MDSGGQTQRGMVAARYLAAAAAIVVGPGGYLLTYQSIGPPNATMFGMVPPLMIAALFGMWRGLGAALLFNVIDVLLLVLTANDGTALALRPSFLIGHSSIFLLAAILGRSRDISVQLRAEIARRQSVQQELAQSELTAHAANRAKSEFLATMSHEIRTPMTGVVGMCDLLQDTELDDEQREFTEIIDKSAHRLLEIINEILDLSRLEAGKISLQKEAFKLEDEVPAALAIVAPAADDKGLGLELTLAPELPCWVRGDPARLRQVLVNLLGNAVKFTERGSISLLVAADGDRGSPRVRFSVIDTGVGVPIHRQAAIFDQFAQADRSTTRKYGGTGLGLAICKGLVVLMGGQIGVRSEEDSGAEFWFTVPLSATQAPVVDDAAPRPAARLDAHVLVVDDNENNVTLTMRLLERLGCTADAAISGCQALERLGAGGYDLVLMDVNMPEMDGLEATRRIRGGAAGKESSIPIIALTAQAMIGDRQRCLDAGMDDYVTKPIVVETLGEAIATLVGRDETVEKA